MTPALHSITLTAPGGATLRSPPELPPDAHLVRASWSVDGIGMHLAGPGRWWVRQHETIALAAELPAGADVTLYWE